MSELFLTEVKLHDSWDGETYRLEARYDKWLGRFIAARDGDCALAKIDCADERLAVTVLATGARRALAAMGVQSVVMIDPDSAMLPLIRSAGYVKGERHYEMPFDLDFIGRKVRVVFAGGVDSSRDILRAMIRRGAAPVLAIGYDRSLRDRVGYADLDLVCNDNGIKLIKTDNINSPEVVAAIADAAPDYLCVFGWSQLVSSELLAVPRIGNLGMHPTKLPQGRGRAPLPWMLIKGLTHNAQSLFWMVEKADEGELADQRPFTIEQDDDAATLYEKIVRVQVEQIEEALPRMAAQTLPRVPQDLSLGEFWPRRRPEDGKIDWQKPSRELYNWVRGLTHPYPGAFTYLHSRKLMVWQADLVDGIKLSQLGPGTIAGVQFGAGTSDGALLVTCGDGGLLALRRLQFEGGEETGGCKFWEKGEVQKGTRFDQ